jgi:mannose-6-phosphate isomerase-like protein (cupin superfamily)
MAVHSTYHPFVIFRAKDAIAYDEAGVMTHEPMSAVAIEGGSRLLQEGVEAGHRVRLLFSMPGFSLTHAWFKSGYPLPRHSHDVDCVYYVVAGTLRIGTEDLGAGDGFFVGRSVPYTYTAGAEGVEVLEFRTSNAFNIKLLADNPSFWDRALATVRERRDGWKTEPAPSGHLVPG